MKKSNVALVAVLGVMTAFADPSITEMDVSAVAADEVKVDFTLAGAPAIVTFDITDANGVSIGDTNLWHWTGEINRRFDADGDYSFTWNARRSWAGNGTVKVKLTVWSVYDPPDYLVSDLDVPGENRYYATVGALPGGLMAHPYRISKLVMRRIRAKGVEWTMGDDPDLNPGAYSKNSNYYAEPHPVMLTNDFYIGVFELTRGQYWHWDNRGSTTYPCYGTFQVDTLMRPAESVPETYLHGGGFVQGEGKKNDDYYWPVPPKTGTYLASLRTHTGLEYYLPSESQWEFAARGGHGQGRWGDGSLITGAAVCSNLQARYLGTAEETPSEGTENYGKPMKSWTVANGTAICGSYPPNDYGLYDMAGNVAEACADWYQRYGEWPEEFAGALYHGDNNLDPNGRYGYRLDGTYYNYHIHRGGSWRDQAVDCHPGYRASARSVNTSSLAPGYGTDWIGSRMCIRLPNAEGAVPSPSSVSSESLTVDARGNVATAAATAGTLEARFRSIFGSPGTDIWTVVRKGILLLVR